MHVHLVQLLEGRKYYVKTHITLLVRKTIDVVTANLAVILLIRGAVLAVTATAYFVVASPL